MAVYSIVKLSEVDRYHRLDSEFYQPEYLANKERIFNSKNQTFSLKKLSSYITNGHTPRYADLTVGDVYFLTAEDILDFVVNFDTSKRIEKNDSHRLLGRTILNTNDLLITIKGKIGNAAVVYKLTGETNINQDVARIIVKKFVGKKKVSPYFIASFINSKFGKLQIEQIATGQINPFLGLNNLKQIVIPLLDEKFQNKIEIVLKKALNLFDESISLHSQAENLLLEELGLKDFKPRYRKTYTAKLSDAFSAHRIDAEYFQPGYEEIFSNLKKGIELKPLKKLILGMQKGIEVGSNNYSEEGKLFIRVSNLSINGFTDKDQKYISKELYQQLKTTYEPKEGDFLLTKDATPGIAYVVKETIEGIISSGILNLKINDAVINKEYLALCINSLIGEKQVERDGGGSVIIHWKPEQIKRLKIPILPLKTQQKIASLVQKSHEARKKAKELLEIAKKAVEIAIEKNEEEALKFIGSS